MSPAEDIWTDGLTDDTGRLCPCWVMSNYIRCQFVEDDLQHTRHICGELGDTFPTLTLMCSTHVNSLNLLQGHVWNSMQMSVTIGLFESCCLSSWCRTSWTDSASILSTGISSFKSSSSLLSCVACLGDSLSVAGLSGLYYRRFERWITCEYLFWMAGS